MTKQIKSVLVQL